MIAPPNPRSSVLPSGTVICGALVWLASVIGGLRGEPVATAMAVPRGLAIADEAGATALTLAPKGKGLRVLILSDSMGLGGFAEELDKCFRACPGVAAVHTIVACGTNPLTWMKMAPYAKAATRCGFMRLESVAGKPEPDTLKDIYGMTKGHKPKAHQVPKIEDLIERIQPDIVVFQNGNNFFDLFKPAQLTCEEKQRQQIRAHVAPLVRWLAANAASVRKFYWVSPAQAGNVTPEVQQFIFELIQAEVASIGVMLDSRKITSYPYPNQEKDKMHFWGKAAQNWGDDTFRLIVQDLVACDIAKAVVLTERKIEVAAPPAQTAKAAKAAGLTLRLRLKATTPVPAPQAFAPYGEFMVAYLYEVVKVLAGSYEEKELLLMHPAYIKHVKQNLERYHTAKELDLVVSEINDDSLWATVHRRDNVGPPELFPYIITEDVAKHPDSPDCHACN